MVATVGGVFASGAATAHWQPGHSQGPLPEQQPSEAGAGDWHSSVPSRFAQQGGRAFFASTDLCAHEHGAANSVGADSPNAASATRN